MQRKRWSADSYRFSSYSARPSALTKYELIRRRAHKSETLWWGAKNNTSDRSDRLRMNRRTTVRQPELRYLVVRSAGIRTVVCQHRYDRNPGSRGNSRWQGTCCCWWGLAGTVSLRSRTSCSCTWYLITLAPLALAVDHCSARVGAGSAEGVSTWSDGYVYTNML